MEYAFFAPDTVASRREAAEHSDLILLSAEGVPEEEVPAKRGAGFSGHAAFPQHKHLPPHHHTHIPIAFCGGGGGALFR